MSTHADRVRRTRRARITVGVIAMSCGLTALMSLIFHREIRLTMMVTGLVCAVVVNVVITRITEKYRRALRAAKRDLEKRVALRTADLSAVNDELKREAAEREALQERLVANERMATAGTLSAAVSHEIRNPLMAIMCNLELAQLKADASNSLLVESLSEAMEGAVQVKQIAVDLATLANPKEDELDAVEIDAVLAAAARLAAHHVRKSATLAVNIPQLRAVMGSAPRLLQVFLNLFTNAAQATGQGRVNLIEVCGRERDGMVEITVTDAGKGIAPDVLARIFEPFFTTKQKVGGTGLGMSICRGIVERSGGSLTVASEVGVGTVVTVKLLAAPHSNVRAAAPEAIAIA